ncbi:hypothetical protein NDU88_001569 [Pleurodeles waltl]|uniref:Uncharacterized protein n=1 Tax=Pleurodeles waltl TaxID=8319 RepID=A0AAV7LYZ4_PLEWA|nr:hypothetical protein NDU88_001569 [Pleurodeles waltl]
MNDRNTARARGSSSAAEQAPSVSASGPNPGSASSGPAYLRGRGLRLAESGWACPPTACQAASMPPAASWSFPVPLVMRPGDQEAVLQDKR